MDTFVRLILWSGYKIDGGRENLQVNNVDFISLRVEGDHILFIPWVLAFLWLYVAVW